MARGSKSRDCLTEAAPDLLIAAQALLANCGHISPFGPDPSVKNIRAAGKYVAAIEALRVAVNKATAGSGA
jgi:hypothetical protein